MYGLNEYGTIIRQTDGASIPADTTNRDYLEYLVWTKAGNVAVSLVDLVRLGHTIKAEAEGTFFSLAGLVTGETINALTIQEWQMKEQLATAWEAEGNPLPALDNKYALAVIEAAGNPDKTPSELMDSWVINAKKWRMLNTAYIAWRQGFRARLKASTTEAELDALRASIEPTLRGMMNLKT